MYLKINLVMIIKYPIMLEIIVIIPENRGAAHNIYNLKI